jgi:CHAT domain-containing protein
MQASEIEEHFVTVNLAAGSQREKQVFLDHLSMHTWRNVSLHVQQAPEDPAALELAVATVLRRKGRVQDAMSLSLSSLRRFLGGDDQKLLDQLNNLNSRLAKLALAAPQRLSAAEQKAEVKSLEGHREDLEEEISRRSAGFFQSSRPVTLDAIQAVIPENAALIEFAVYRPFDAKAPDNEKAYGDPHYVAYVIRRRGEVQWQELGGASAIDQAIDGLRQALRDPQRKDVRELARAVDERVLRSARSLAGDATHLLISPDGQLNLIPFEALVDEQGRYMAEHYSISYLTTGRDLLRMQVARESKTRPVIVADPFFGEPGTTKTARSGAQLKAISVGPRRRSILPTDDLSGAYFAPLSGTAQEAHAIQSLFPEAELLIGPQATKSTLQQVVAPRILHIATHGFFLQSPAVPSQNFARSGLNNGRRIYSGFKMEDPLLRSGLALSGANLNLTGNSDGILTALEVSNLNLWGTRLVTLSACETGVGVVKNGEGVYGLRRSFFLAGAETLMMSLWSVSDRTTREMMISYYTGLKGGLGRGEALHQAELAMMKRKSRSHPFYWASFIQLGEWANLDGQR